MRAPRALAGILILHTRFPQFLHAVLLLAALLMASVASPATAAGLRYGQGVLWQLERDGAAPSYLFGTIHVADDRVLDLPAPVEAAFSGSASASFEIVLNASHKMRFAQTMVLTDGRTLDSILGAELFGQVATLAGAYGLTPATLKMFKPWALVPILSYPPEQLARIAAGELPLDQWLQEEANSRGKAVHALETFDEQLSLFNDMPEADQVEIIRTIANDPVGVEGRFEQTLTLYLARDVGGIHAQMLEQTSPAERNLAETFEQEFIIERNHRMVERMAARLAEGRAFIAVGALHLPGDEGILHLLEQRGYRITRLY